MAVLGSSSLRHPGAEVRASGSRLTLPPPAEGRSLRAHSVAALLLCIPLNSSVPITPPLPLGVLRPALKLLGEGFSSYNYILLPTFQIPSEFSAPILVIPVLLRFPQSNNEEKSSMQMNGENIFFKQKQRNKNE